MTIGALGTNALAARTAGETFRSQKSTLDALQLQLSSGKVSDTYGGFAPGASTSLALRSRLAGNDAYASGIADANLRVKVLSAGLAEIDRIGSSLKTTLPGTYKETSIGQTSAETSAVEGLGRVIELLNTDVGGRYLYSGRTTDRAPVESYDLIVNGDATRAGLKGLVSQRKAADRGADGLGRLAVSSSGTTTTLSETASPLPFGLKIASASATGSGALSASRSAGPPASAALGVASLPVAGDAVSVVLNLPDGSQSTITLTAIAADATPPAASPDGTSASFALGSDAASTAANLKAALTAAISSQASTTLASASAAKASRDFFAGSASSPPERVAGPPYDTATATVAGTAANTVIWYAGDDASGSPRETAPVKTGDGTSVAIGFRANEAGFAAVLSALGSLVADDFPASDPTSQARYAGAASRVGAGVDLDTVQTASADLSVASASLGAATKRLTGEKAQIQDLIDGLETADPNEVGSRLLAAQTRLQASYQATSLVARLSLVNFI